MNNNASFTVTLLELHLFFARIMKEHSLFLMAGFTPADACFAKEAEYFMKEFDDLLSCAVSLSDGIIRQNVLCSGEIITEFTSCAEQQTQHFTGIPINGKLTEMEYCLRCCENPCVSMKLCEQVSSLNQTAIELLNGLIELKERILNHVLCCRMFTMNYPLLLEHIIREAKLYRTCICNFENGDDFDCQNIKQTEQFWNQIMMEHALFIRGLLDPTENELIAASDSFAKEYACLLAESQKRNDCTMTACDSLQETLKFKEFKKAGTQGIEDCQIRSIILPLLADHVLREANHYIRLLCD